MHTLHQGKNLDEIYCSRGENKLKQPKFVGQKRVYTIYYYYCIRIHDNFSTNRSSIQRTGKSRTRDLQGCFTCPLNALTHTYTHEWCGHFTFMDRQKVYTHTHLSTPINHTAGTTIL